MNNRARVKEEIVAIGKRLYAKGLVVANDGNISVRTGSDEVLITPTGVNKGLMNEEMISGVDLAGNQVFGSTKPSSELEVHLEAYRCRPDIQAVVHAHPPVATGFAAAGVPLDKPVLPEVVLRLGWIPLVAYGTPSTLELSGALSEYLPEHEAFLLANHGVLTVGKDLLDAYDKMETVEFYARVLLVARLLGGERELTAEQLQKLLKTIGKR